MRRGRRGLSNEQTLQSVGFLFLIGMLIRVIIYMNCHPRIAVLYGPAGERRQESALRGEANCETFCPLMLVHPGSRCGFSVAPFSQYST